MSVLLCVCVSCARFASRMTTTHKALIVWTNTVNGDMGRSLGECVSVSVSVTKATQNCYCPISRERETEKESRVAQEEVK